MYHAGDTVVYGAQGVCTITSIEENDISGSSMEYYVLKPVYDANATIFVPVKNETLVGQMRQVLSAEEIYALIRSMPDEQTIWLEDEDERKKTYQEIIRRGDRKELVQLIKTLHFHQQKQQQKGKRLHQADETALKQAEQLLYHEFALVLHIKPEEVVPFIISNVTPHPISQG